MHAPSLLVNVMHLLGAGGVGAGSVGAGACSSSIGAPLTWDEAHACAADKLKLLNQSEKASLLLGVGWNTSAAIIKQYGFPQLEKWHYVGNIPPIPHAGIPPINMQDAAGGFRTYWSELVGTVTCWPSLLSMAATFDTAMMDSFATALGQEFAAKGANTILGPSINVHRVARNGRNFEYLSGEDPFLGARLAERYVRGVQKQGVMSVMKHFVFNSQETHRNSESSVVDDKTAWELYYPPFQAAVDAGIAGVMCSYNKVNGSFACANGNRLHRDLKTRMGFRSFVQSDWGATHAMSIAEGLDEEMPIPEDFPLNKTSPYWYSLANLQGQDLDVPAGDIIAALAKVGVLGQAGAYCTPPCEAELRANVTSDAHAALARDAATASIVLLQNDRAALPIDTTAVRTIAVVGAASVGKAFDPAGGGQGPAGGRGTWNTGDYYSGGGSGHVTAPYVVTPLDGIRRRAEAAGITVLSSPTNNATAAAELAAQADVTIVVGATSSGEALDRVNLLLDADANHDPAEALIYGTAAAARRTVVLLQVPGSVLTPWRASVDAVAAMFLGGQETGSAWASVLFGDVSPTGKLPVTFPQSEADTIAPDGAAEVVYSEGLQTSYRAPGYDPAYPFGHGLSYSNFTYTALAPTACVDLAYKACLSANVTNVGVMAAAVVTQLYATFPAEAAQPSALLRGFAKSPTLAPGASAPLVFGLSTRDLSYWSESCAVAPYPSGWCELDSAQLTFTLRESSAESSVRATLRASR